MKELDPMLTKEQLNAWYVKNQINEKGRAKIEEIRDSEPERRVNSSIKNVAGRYPSRRMGFSIQFESHTVELPFIYEVEHSDLVLEYYDQPNLVKFDYMSQVDGRDKRKVFKTTPDFFVMYDDHGCWVECKPEEKLQELSLEDPYRYYKDEDGCWRCPPGEHYAQSLNLQFKVFSSEQIDWVLHRNIKFLETYFLNDYEVTDEQLEKVQSIIKEQQGIELDVLLEHTDELKISSDVVNTLIASNAIYVDLKKYILAEPQYTHVFSDYDIANAFVHLENAETDVSANMSHGCVLEVGKSLVWDSKEWEILNVGTSYVSLRSQQNTIDLTFSQIESYVQQGKIIGIKHADSLHAKVQEEMLKASREELIEANERLKIIRPYLDGESPETEHTSLRTIRSWIEQYRHAQQAYGNGYIGLLSRHRDKGNRISRLPEKTKNLIEEWVKENYETFKQKKKAEVYGDFLIECDLKLIEGCSYKSFVKAVNSRPIYEQENKRKGEKAAYRFESFYLEYSLTTIRHGDRPFEIGHIDHTELDIELIDSVTKKGLGKPWATFLTDGCTRKILAIYVTFDPPSYRSCMMVLRECVKRFSRLPETIVVDGGKEFSSVYFETVLSAFGSGKKERPASKPKFGSTIERLFGTTNTRFIYNLTGNTQITKNVRQITKKNNPKKLAIWTIANFTERLKQFAYEVYDCMGHPALRNQSPQEAFLLGLKRTGERFGMMIPYDETFRILTMPTSEKGTAKVEPGRGFKNNYNYYWSDAFKHPDVKGKQIPIRYDPYNIGIAYAYVNKHWVKCMSDYFAVFNGKTEKQIKVASNELKKQYQKLGKQFRMDIKILANFLRNCESDELLLQQMKDNEVHSTVTVLSGGKEAKESQQKNVTQNSKINTIEANFEGDDTFDVQERYGEF
jgi:putative transposase